MRVVVRSLVKGLGIILPIVITIELLRWLLVTVETRMAPLLENGSPQGLLHSLKKGGAWRLLAFSLSVL